MAYKTTTATKTSDTPFLYPLYGTGLGSVFFADDKLEAQKYVSVQGHALTLASYDLRQRAIKQGCKFSAESKQAGGKLESCSSTLTTWANNFNIFEGRVLSIGQNFDSLNRFAQVEAALQYQVIVQDLKKQYEILRKSFETITQDKGLALPGEPSTPSSILGTVATLGVVLVSAYLGWRLYAGSRPLSSSETPRYAGGQRR